MLKRLALLMSVLIIFMCVPVVFAEDAPKTEDVFILTSVVPLPFEVFAGTAFEDTEAYFYFADSQTRIMAFADGPNAIIPMCRAHIYCTAKLMYRLLPMGFSKTRTICALQLSLPYWSRACPR
jgi:hypothetical protein